MSNRIARKRAVLVAVLAVIALVSMVAVAQAAAPVIASGARPPSGHFQGACSGCHTIARATPTGGGVAPDPQPGANETSDTVEADDHQGVDEQADGIDPADADHADDQAGAVSNDGSGVDESVGADANDSHETLTPRIKEHKASRDGAAAPAAHQEAPNSGEVTSRGRD
jgi:hypothetical protein